MNNSFNIIFYYQVHNYIDKMASTNGTSNTMQNIRSIISNPNTQAFKNRYLPLGKVGGKSLLREDCKRLKISIPVSGLTVIEKGFSHKSKVTYENSMFGAATDFASARWGDDKVGGSGGGDGKNMFERMKDREDKKEQDARLLQVHKKKLLIEKRRQAKADKIKKKMAERDSWEDAI